MRKIPSILFVLSILFTPLQGFAAADVKDQMLLNLDIIKNTFEVKYAPAEWKMAYADWDLDEKIYEAKLKVIDQENLTVKDYQRILLEFFNSTQDYHVGVNFYSTEMAFLPFRVQSTNGKYFVAWAFDPFFVNFEKPLKKGDEILLFDDMPVHEVVNELKRSEYGNPLSATDQALAECALTMRAGASGNLVPKGSVNITVRHAGTQEVTTYPLSWNYQAEQILDSLSPFIAAEESKLLKTDGTHYFMTKSSFQKPLGEHWFFYKDMATPLYKQYKKGIMKRNILLSSIKGEDDQYIGSKASDIPQLGKVIWEASKTFPFKAYIFLDQKGRKIGYIRIAHYMAGSQSAEKFGEFIRMCERKTDALVVDQINNPGGNVFYMYALASFLADGPLTVPKHKMTITQEDVYFALEKLDSLEQITTDDGARQVLGATIAGYPVDLDLARGIERYFRFILDEWREGRQTTNYDYLNGLEAVKPNPYTHFTKPILFLVNELDFSCADFLPAILQDNHRAKILGIRTSGAGGYVLNHSFPNRFGIQGFSYTGSLAQRVDLNPIENLGVIPDNIVEFTERDLEENYPDYVDEVLMNLTNLMEEG